MHTGVCTGVAERSSGWSLRHAVGDLILLDRRWPGQGAGSGVVRSHQTRDLL